MKLGIMQPYFFPYLGYFELIARTDRWVVFDVVQYNPRSWMSRNRILHPSGGWQYINVPVARSPHGTAISAIRLRDRVAARQRILGQIEHYRMEAPHFRAVTALVDSTFAISSDRLVDLNVAGLSAVCAYLGLNFSYSICSQAGFDLEGVTHAGDWALKIAGQLGASEYLNPVGGRAIFRQSDWDAASIRLGFIDPPDLRYACGRYEFVEHLSILDVLMWNDPETVRHALLAKR
ncbi:MAG TPA: WbqC family protein [Caulobacteraceae bacterium]|nr:WbqC family protein [Caulobacteraceae bacterium]